MVDTSRHDAKMDSMNNTKTLTEIMTRYDECRAKFETRFGAEFDENLFHAWFTKQVARDGQEVR